MGKLPQILPKFDVALIRQRVVTKRCNLRKLENIISRGISTLQFGEKYANLPFPISEEAWRRIAQVSVQSVAIK